MTRRLAAGIVGAHGAIGGRQRGYARRLGLLIIAATLFSMAACGSTSGSSTTKSASLTSFKGQTLTVLISSSGGGAQGKKTQEFYDFLAQQFHAKTGATVRYQYWSSAGQENSIIQTSIVSGSGPDLIGYGSSSVISLAALKAFHVLSASDWKKLGGRSSFLPVQLTMSGVTPKQDIGIPGWSTPYLIAYNKGLFQKAGIGSPPKTWSAYIDDAQKVMKANPGVYGAGIDPADGKDPWKFVWSYTHQLGGSWATRNGKKVTVDNTQTTDAVNFYLEQAYKYHITPPGSLTWTNAQMISAFVAGQVAMVPLANEGTQTAAAGTPTQGEIGFAPLPSIPYGLSKRPKGGTAAQQIVAGNYWAIPNYAAGKKNLALAMAQVMMSPAVELKQYQLLGVLPVTKAGLSMLQQKEPDSKIFAEAIQGSEPTEITPAWDEVESGVNGVINRSASQAATSGSVSTQYIKSQLAAAQTTAQGSA